MKVLLVGNYSQDRQESMQRFANVMEGELSLAGHEVRQIRPTVRLGNFSFPKKLEKWVGYVDKFVLFPVELRRAAAWADIVHICDHSNAMYIKHVISKPHLITCHDLLAVRSAKGDFPQNRVGFTGRLLQAWICRWLRSAKSVVCISNATLNDCKNVLGKSSMQLEVIYLGLNYPYSPMPIAEANIRLGQFGIPPDQNYLLNIGNNSWYKNRLFSLKTFSLLVKKHNSDSILIFAGRDLTPEMNEFVALEGLKDRIKQLGSISNEDLRALYSRADGLLFPSLEEGFGWPILEAQASGCPVFTSNRAPMTEVGGDAAVYIDPLSPESAAATISNRHGSLDNMRRLGLINASSFSNLAMRESYETAYRRVCSTK